jgi:hypothetical protein
VGRLFGPFGSLSRSTAAAKGRLATEFHTRISKLLGLIGELVECQCPESPRRRLAAPRGWMSLRLNGASTSRSNSGCRSSSARWPYILYLWMHGLLNEDAARSSAALTTWSRENRLRRLFGDVKAAAASSSVLLGSRKLQHSRPLVSFHSTKLANVAGPYSNGVVPNSASRALILGSERTAFVAKLRTWIISWGVSFGAANPHQLPAWKPGTKSLSTGTFGVSPSVSL